MKNENGVLSKAGTISAGIVVSRILGLVRDILIAAVLGSSWVADIFLAAFRLPNFMRRLLQDGAIAFAFIPIFNKLLYARDRGEAFAFARGALLQALLYTLAFVGLCMLATGAIALIMFPGFSATPDTLAMTSSLMRVTFFYIPLVSVTAILASMLLSMGKVLGPAMTPAAMNAGIIAAAIYAISEGFSGYNAALFFCYGLILGGFLQIILQLPSLYRSGFRIIGPMERSTSSNVSSFVRNSPLSTVGSAAYQLGVLLSALFASFLGHGNVSALYFSERLIEFPLSIIGVALGLACISNFSNLILQNQLVKLAAELGKVLGVCAFLSFPAAFGMFIIAEPLVRLIYEHGAFDQHGVDLTIRALKVYTLALPALVATRPVLSALNAMGRQSMTMLLCIISLIIHVSLSIILLQFLELEAITVSAVVACWLNLAMLSLALRKTAISEYCSFIYPYRSIITHFFISVAMFIVAFLFRYWAEDNKMHEGMVVGLTVLLGIIVYSLLCKLCRSDDFSRLQRKLLGGNKEQSDNAV